MEEKIAVINKQIEKLIANNEGIVISIDKNVDTLDVEKQLNANIVIGAIVFKNFPESRNEYGDFLKKNHDAIKNKNILIIIVGENAGRKDKLFRMISGVSSNEYAGKQLLGTELHGLMEDSGFQEESKYDLLYDDKSNVDNYDIFLARESLINQYLTWMQEFIGSDYMTDIFIRSYRGIEVPLVEEETPQPFLSIITRTQGRRPEALRETLLSLAGQSCMDFELIVMGHKLSLNQKEIVEQIIDDVPEFLHDKIRLVLVDKGNRTTPINCGFECARGKYAVILDDDDLVLDNWVSSFKEKAQEYPGRVLHAYVIAQDWCTVNTRDGVQALRACGSVQNQFCKDFHLFTELNGNYCPVLGLAFPLFPFKKLGIRFDETLETTEDWDFLMRITSLCGVVDIPIPTSVYRLWRNIENSYSLHDKEVWVENHKKIQNKFKSKPLLLPKEYVTNLIDAVENYGDVFDESLRKKEYGQITALYLNHGKGYAEKWSVHASTKVALPNFKYEFSELETYGEIKQIRWDPYDRGGIMVDEVQATIVLQDGKKIIKNIGDMTSNGFRCRGKMVILHSDPQIYITLPKKEIIAKIVIEGHLFKRVPDEEYEYISASYDSNLIQKTAKHGRRIAHKIVDKIRK